MRILICAIGYNSSKRNVDIFELDQAKALSDYGHDIRIASIDLRSVRRLRSWRSSVYELCGMKVYTVNIPCGRVPANILNVASQYAAKKAFHMACADGWKPDVIHAHFTSVAYAFADVVKQNKIPYVVTEHSSAMNQEAIPDSLRKIAQYAYDRADALLAVSRALANSIERHTGHLATVIPNVVNLDTFKVCDEMRFEKDFRFVTACNLIVGKRVHLLLEAFSKLNRKDITLEIFGQGAERTRLEQRAKSLKIIDRVRFRGHCTRSELQRTYSKSDCFVLSSVSETFGVVYIEAMAAGLPVIATRCGGPEDFVTLEVGLLVPVDDVEALTQAMKVMVETARNYDSVAIHRYAMERFSPEKIALELTGIYKIILKKDEDVV